MDNLKWNITTGNLDDVKKIMETGDTSVNTSIKGRLPIHYAADFGQDSIIEYLISRGAEINKQDSYGITPLLAAIFEGHPSTVRLLLAKGADPKGKSPDGKSYMDCAESEEIKLILTKL